MPKHRPSVERFIEAAQDVNTWLSRLGNACCAGTSYRRMDKAKGQPDCQQASPGKVPEAEPSRTTRSSPVDKAIVGGPDATHPSSLI
jgi:hypothetical protein